MVRTDWEIHNNEKQTSSLTDFHDGDRHFRPINEFLEVLILKCLVHISLVFRSEISKSQLASALEKEYPYLSPNQITSYCTFTSFLLLLCVRCCLSIDRIYHTIRLLQKYILLSEYGHMKMCFLCQLACSFFKSFPPRDFTICVIQAFECRNWWREASRPRGFDLVPSWPPCFTATPVSSKNCCQEISTSRRRLILVIFVCKASHYPCFFVSVSSPFLLIHHVWSTPCRR